MVDWTSFSAAACPEFIKLQANPTRDVMDFGSSDTRYLAPAIDATDTQHLLSATVKQYRLLASLNASCVGVEAANGAQGREELRVVARLVGGDGQNAGASVLTLHTQTSLWKLDPALRLLHAISTGSLHRS